MSVARVEVNFTTSPSRSEFTQNDSNQGMGMAKHSFRKTIRFPKDRGQNMNFKKDPNLFGLNDITGIPLKDDSSRVSRTSSHNAEKVSVGFGEDKGWSFAPKNKGLEIAMYVLLGVFSVAILVFVASCVVYASRVKKREITHPEDLEIKFEHGGLGGRVMTLGGGYAATTNAHDWVWLGRTSLALHPSLDSRQHSSHQSNKSVSFESGRILPNTNVRITANPNFENNGRIQVLPIGLNGTPTPQRPPRPETGKVVGQINTPPQLSKPSPLTSPAPIDSTTFCKSKLQSPQTGHPESPPEYRPPVPPHRNVKPMMNYGISSPTAPPPIPTSSPPRSATNSTKSNSSNHHRHQSRKEPLTIPEDSFSGTEFDYEDGRNRQAEKGSNVIRNPMCFIDEEEEDEDYRDEFRRAEPLTVAAAAAAKRNHRVKNHSGDSVKLNMDYDQLMEYFDSLKETEA